jgi:hypothetical protein
MSLNILCELGNFIDAHPNSRANEESDLYARRNLRSARGQCCEGLCYIGFAAGAPGERGRYRSNICCLVNVISRRSWFSGLSKPCGQQPVNPPAMLRSLKDRDIFMYHRGEAPFAQRIIRAEDVVIELLPARGAPRRPHRARIQEFAAELI